MPRVGQPIEFHATFRFKVLVDGINLAAFIECNLPSLQVETEDIKEGGQNTYTHRLPVRVNAGTVTLKQGITRNDQLLNWYLQVLRGDIESATRTVSVIILDSIKIPIATWTFYDAYPIKWGGLMLKSSDQAVAIEELELAHHGFEVG
jgi:phage tail-like protein